MKETITRGAIGLAGGFAWMTLAGFETAIRLASSLGGLVVVILTIVTVSRKLPPARHRRTPADAGPQQQPAMPDKGKR